MIVCAVSDEGGVVRCVIYLEDRVWVFEKVLEGRGSIRIIDARAPYAFVMGNCVYYLGIKSRGSCWWGIGH